MSENTPDQPDHAGDIAEIQSWYSDAEPDVPDHKGQIEELQAEYTEDDEVALPDLPGTDLGS